MTDLHLLARVFIDYRSAYTVNAPACQEIIRLLNEAGLDVMNMSNDAILLAVTPQMVRTSFPQEEKPRGRGKHKPVEPSTDEETTEEPDETE